MPAGREHVWHQYTMRFPGERQRVMDGLAERGIGSLIYYPVPVHRQAYLQELIPGVADQDLPVTEPPRRRGAVDPGSAHPRGHELQAVIEAVRAVASPARDTAAFEEANR